VRFIATVLDAGVEFRAADVPDASRLLLHILSAVAEAEAEAISARTKAALKAAKDRGTQLGGANPACRNLTREAAQVGRSAGAAANRIKATERYADVAPMIRSMRDGGKSLRIIAKVLDVEFPRATAWQASQVSRVLNRAA
jgi:DNA invertase Pin-like site-specific DNA recombinase